MTAFEFVLICFVRLDRRRIHRLAAGAGRRADRDPDADAGAEGGHPLRHRREHRLDHRDLERRGGGVRARAHDEPARGDGARDRHDARRADRRLPGRPDRGALAVRGLRRRHGRLGGDDAAQAPQRGQRRRRGHAVGELPAPARQLLRRRARQGSGLSRRPRAPRAGADVRRRHDERAAGHRLRRAQGAGDGPGHAPADQGLHRDEQLHDRRHRRRQRGAVFRARRHQPVHRRPGRGRDPRRRDGRRARHGPAAPRPHPVLLRGRAALRLRADAPQGTERT